MKRKAYTIPYIQAVLFEIKLQKLARKLKVKATVEVFPVINSPTISKLVVVTEDESFLEVVDSLFK